MPPSYSDNLSTNLTSNDSSFNLLPQSLSGQTLQSALDNLSKGGGFNDLQFNGGHLGSGVLDPGSLGGQTPSSGFGLSPSLTPSKVDYSDWGTGSTSGSAPGSANKNTIGDPYRGDPAQVRRNMVSTEIVVKNRGYDCVNYRTRCGPRTGKTEYNGAIFGQCKISGCNQPSNPASKRSL